MQTVQIQWAGQVEYDTAWDWQKRVVAQKMTDPHASDQLILLEHPPTYTLGRSGTLDHLLLAETELADAGFTLRWVDRGGDVTYHGPGQLVGYPILNLKQKFSRQGKPYPDLHQYLRQIEEMIILTLAQFDIDGWRYGGYTGVWVDGEDGPAKIAAIGIRVNGKGISSHGFALNINPDLTHFAHIIPCGIREHGVTSMSQQLQRPLTSNDLIPVISTIFCQTFNYQPQPIKS